MAQMLTSTVDSEISLEMLDVSRDKLKLVSLPNSFRSNIFHGHLTVEKCFDVHNRVESIRLARSFALNLSQQFFLNGVLLFNLLRV